jgi:methionyl-tRNA synthetase
MAFNQIDITDFQKLDLRVGTIKQAERVPNTKKLYKIKVDLGELGVKQTVAGLVGHYLPEELVGKKIVFLSNLKPVTLAGETSEGMLLASEKDGKVALLTVDREIPDGSKIR